MKVYDEAKVGAVLKARRLRRDSTDAEKTMWRALRSSLPGYKWRRQMPIGPYIADFACFSEQLIIELDGGQHSEDRNAKRSAFLNGEGYRVIRFWNNEVLANISGVIESVANALSSSPSRSASLSGSLPLPRERAV